MTRLREAKGATLKWSAVPAVRSERCGHAEVLVDARHSIAKVDLLSLPSVPQGKIDEELRDGAEDFVNGIRDHGQGDNHLVMTLP